MSSGMPTERQLRGLEQRVLTRIRRRTALRARLVSGTAVAALVVGAFVLVHPGLSTGTGASGGSAAGSAARPAGASAVVRCHVGSERASAFKVVRAPAEPTADSVAAACVGSRSTMTTASSPVVCRRADGSYEVFRKDAHPGTLCTRNGLTAG
jgi:hypothetical protein